MLGKLVLSSWLVALPAVVLADVRVDYDRHKDFSYRYRYGYWGAPYYGDVVTRRYIEGALTVDVIERDSGALVYRALVTDEAGKDLDKQVAKSIDKAFKKFPVKEVKNDR